MEGAMGCGLVYGVDGLWAVDERRWVCAGRRYDGGGGIGELVLNGMGW